MFMTKVRKGDAVWLSKEQRKGFLDTAWIPPRPGHAAGQIGVDGQVWYIQIDGSGFDGILLIEPLDGEEYDEERPIPDIWKVQVEFQLACMETELAVMHHELSALHERLCQPKHNLKLHSGHHSLLAVMGDFIHGQEE
jgi:hypothetical protein